MVVGFDVCFEARRLGMIHPDERDCRKSTAYARKEVFFGSSRKKPAA
jgi:hypothetical protein